MADIDATTLDARRLQHFVLAAESPTLSEAAQRLFLTQQALSASMQQLERDLAVTLFDRTGRRLALSPAGRALHEGAAALLAGHSALIRTVRDVAAGTPVPYVVGHTPSISSDEVYRLLSPAIAAHPDQTITARQVSPEQMPAMLVDQSIDIALRPGTDTPDHLASAVVTNYRLRVAVSARHPAAARPTVTARDLSDTPIVVWTRPHQSFYTDFLVSYCRSAGFEPNLVISGIHGTPPATAILRHPQACVFVTDPVGTLYDGEVQVVDLEEPPLLPVQALWLPHTISPLRSAIIEQALPPAPTAG
ncbi:LysR family transcriptional regulator [Gordonia sp. CPCC 205515]|uniref:LysR family transcriptional regulator n=1 Tax=Gordonia sp. CPCC 205515 TaxID=3140791 RepID=UPI003AF3E3E0